LQQRKQNGHIITFLGHQLGKTDTIQYAVTTKSNLIKKGGKLTNKNEQKTKLK